MMRNIGVLAVVSTLGQALTFLVAPLLTRLYSPEEFAIYSLIATISGFVASVITGRLETAIPLPSEEEKGVALLGATIIAASVLSLIITGAVLVFPASIADTLGGRSLMSILWLIPLAALASAYTQSLSFLLVRRRSYNQLAVNNLVQTVIATGTQALTPLAGVAFSGLLLSLVIAPIIASGHLLHAARTSLRRLTLTSIRETAWEYRQYPSYGTAIAIVNSVSLPLVTWFIFRSYGPEMAGFYALAQRLLVTPARVLQESIRKVFWGEVAEQIRTAPERTIPLFMSLLRKLLALATPFVLLTMVFSEQLVTIVFGEAWRGSGFVVAVLAPMASASLAVTTIANFSMIGQQRLGLVWSIIQTLSVVCIMVASAFFEISFHVFLIAFSVTMVLSYALQVAMWLLGAKTLPVAIHLPSLNSGVSK